MNILNKTNVWLSILSFVWMLMVPNHLLAADAEVSKEVGKVSSVEIALGKSRLFKYAQPITRISVGDAGIADVMVVSPNQIYLVGKKVGATNVFLWHTNGNISTLDIAVGADVASLQSLLAKLMPGEKNIRASSAGESLVLNGQVSDSMKVQQAMLIAQEYTGKKALNMMTTDHLPQVLIEVKIAEIDKAISDSLGLQVQGSNFSFNMLNGATAPLGFAANATGTVGTTNAWLQAQINSGLIKILAEPNIMAISGQEGEFLSGGIVFLPVPQSSGTGGAVITLQAQNYGVGVKFTPTVLSEGRINLKVSPQVSEVNTTGITVTSGTSTTVLPSITTRQASTTVQLYDGQSFAIGGLMKNNVAEVISAFPGLANLPVIGALFRSASFKADRSELLIVVTPHIVQPVPNKITLPTDKFTQPTQAEFFVNGQLEGSKPELKNEEAAK
jgi:pilus assembly protein CpaC